MIKIITSIILSVVVSIGMAQNDERRVALIIGNSNYSVMGALKNAENDAVDMASSLHRLGFDVVYGTNLTKKGMSEKIRQFDGKLKAGKPENTIGLFYYAGHGLEVDGNNFLVPVDAQMEYQEDARDEGVALNRITRRMNYTKNRLNIVILDACRNNPLPKLDRNMSGGGWGELTDVASGMFIAYGTSPGQKALDSIGSGRNGVFTKQILDNIETQGLTLEQVFKKTRAGVLTDTNGRQTTWQNNATTGDFYFAPMVKNNSNNSFNNVSQAPRKIDPEFPSQYRNVGEIFKDCPSCPEMIAIPAGRFQMGQNKDDAYNNPKHQVNISQFNLSTTEVTVDQFKAFVAETGYQTTAERSGCNVYTDTWLEPKDANWKNPYYQQTGSSPVVCISWNDADKYIQWLSDKTKKPYRLASESEWEYAALAGNDGKYSWGDFVDCGRAAYGLKDCNISKPTPVKSYPANAFGLYDMHGNVSEWLADCWHGSYVGAPINGDAWIEGCDDDYKRTSRGGTWILPASDMVANKRTRANKHMTINDLGFRVAQD